MLCLDLAVLKSDQEAFVAVTPHVDELGLDPGQYADVYVTVTMKRAAEQILVILEASATAMLVCDRTLDGFRSSVRGMYRLLLVPEASEPAVDYDETVTFDTAMRHVDLTDAVRDTLLLALPARRVAPGAEDVEIQTVFGAPDGESLGDYRWGALLALR